MTALRLLNSWQRMQTMIVEVQNCLQGHPQLCRRDDFNTVLFQRTPQGRCVLHCSDRTQEEYVWGAMIFVGNCYCTFAGSWYLTVVLRSFLFNRANLNGHWSFALASNSETDVVCWPGLRVAQALGGKLWTSYKASTPEQRILQDLLQFPAGFITSGNEHAAKELLAYFGSLDYTLCHPSRSSIDEVIE